MRTVTRWIVVIAVSIGACFLAGNLIENYEVWERVFSIIGGVTMALLSFVTMLWLLFGSDEWINILR